MKLTYKQFLRGQLLPYFIKPKVFAGKNETL